MWLIYTLTYNITYTLKTFFTSMSPSLIEIKFLLKMFLNLCVSISEGEDYMSISRALTFSDSVRFETVGVVIFDDLLSEGIESFRLELRDGNGELTTSSLVEIVDDESELVIDGEVCRNKGVRGGRAIELPF